MPENRYITLNEAAKLTPRRVHASTLWRWARKGCRARNGERIHLAHLRVGGRVMTTEAALEEFFRELAAADVEGFDAESDAPPPQLPKPVKDEDRSAAVEHAKRTAFA